MPIILILKDKITCIYIGITMSIEAINIFKKFNQFTALNHVNLRIDSGELVALLGPSGSGKTTLLRIIAGLEQADSGEILLDGEHAHNKAVQERQVGFVFQHYALFKHITVFENVAFGLRMRPKAHRPSDAEIHKKVMNLLEMVHLEAFYNRYPHQLSGGQRQRVALARALAVEPKLLLLDEPFGALDAKVRQELRRWMRRLHDEINLTSIFVTHDQEEAMEVSDRVVVMNNAQIEQVGTPAELWQNPKNQFVYDFLGEYNLFAGIKNGTSDLNIDTKCLELSDKHTPIYVRPHEMLVSKQACQESVAGEIVHINPVGSMIKIEVATIHKKPLQAAISHAQAGELAIALGDTVYLRPQTFRLF